MDGYGTLLSAKGHNSRVLCEWLRHSLSIHETADPRHDLTKACLKLVKNDENHTYHGPQEWNLPVFRFDRASISLLDPRPNVTANTQ